MTLCSSRPRTDLRAVLYFLLCVSVSRSQIGAEPFPTNKPPEYPAWWFSRSVIPRKDPPAAAPSWPVDYRQADDYAVLNQGQLKSLATAAYEELQSQSIGAGPVVTALIKGWYNLNPDGTLPAPGSRVWGN